MSAVSAAQAWVATPSAVGLLSREFDDGTVCFDPHTGETRLLSALNWFTLALLADAAPAALPRDRIVAQVLAVDDSGADATTAGALVDGALAELLQAGLIDPGEAA